MPSTKEVIAEYLKDRGEDGEQFIHIYRSTNMTKSGTRIALRKLRDEGSVTRTDTHPRLYYWIGN